LYLNYDCDLRFTDVCQNLLSQVSQLTFPTTLSEPPASADETSKIQYPPLGSIPLLALHCLLYAQHALCAHPLTAVPEVSAWEHAKGLKAEYATCVEEFNRKPKLGMQKLAAARIADVYHEDASGKPVVPDPAEMKKLARFIRETPGLNKGVLGDVLGRTDEVCKALLVALVELFDFRGLTVDQALRVFLEAFRLPGEAQQIDRIVQV
jgi:Sec7-like guanine-nucleotide exchange factor